MKSWRWTFITITVISVLIPIEIVGNWNIDDYDSQQRRRREDEWNDWLFKKPGEPDDPNAESENAVKKEENNPSQANNNVNSNGQNQIPHQQQITQPPQNNQQYNQMNPQQPQIQPFAHNQNPNPAVQQNLHPQRQLHPHQNQNQHQQIPHQNLRHGNNNNFQGPPNQILQPNPPYQNLNQQQQAQLYQQQQQEMYQMNQQIPPNGVYPNQPHNQRQYHNNFHNQGHGYAPPPLNPQGQGQPPFNPQGQGQPPFNPQGQGQPPFNPQGQGQPPFNPQGQIPFYPPYQPYQPYPPQVPGQPLPLAPQGNNIPQQGQIPYNPQQPGGQPPLNPVVVNPEQEKATTKTTTTTSTTTTAKTTTKNLYFAGPDYIKQNQNQNQGPAEPNSWLFDIPPSAPEPEPQRGINPNPPNNNNVPVPVNPQQGQGQGSGQIPVNPPNTHVNHHPHHPIHPHVYPVPLIPTEQQGQNLVNPPAGQGQPPFRPEPETTKKTTTKNLYFAGPEYIKERNPNEEQGVNPYLVDLDAYKYNNNNYNGQHQNHQPLVVRAGNEDEDAIRAGGHLPNKYKGQNPPEEWDQNQNQNNFYGNNNELEMGKDPNEIDSYGSYLSNHAQNHAYIHRGDGNTNTNEKEQENGRSSWKDRFMSLINPKSKSKQNPDTDSAAMSLFFKNKQITWMLSYHFIWFKVMRFNI